MAGDWIKVEHSLPDKPEVVSIASAVGIDQDSAAGKCLRWFIWLDQQVEDCNAVSVTDAFIDRLTFCPGFAAALRRVGWLEGRECHLSVPNFDRHNGQTAKIRAQSKDRQQRKRDSVTETLRSKRDETRDASSLLFSYSSLLNSVLEGTSFDCEEVRTALADWIGNYERLAGKKADAIKLRHELAECRTKKWDSAKLIDSIAFSISIESMRLRPREDDYDKQRKNGFHAKPQVDVSAELRKLRKPE